MAGPTVNRGLAVLSNMFTFALKSKGIIQIHPMTRYGRIPEDQKALRIMDLEEERRLVDAVLEKDVVEVGRSSARDGRDRAELHQQAAVTVQHHDLAVGPGEGDAGTQSRRTAHEADAGHVERAGREAMPGRDDLHRGDDDALAAFLSNGPKRLTA